MAGGGDEPELQRIEGRPWNRAGQICRQEETGLAASAGRAREALPKLEQSLRKCVGIPACASFFVRIAAHCPSLTAAPDLRQGDTAPQRRLARRSIFAPS
jgi:hypothetical protein